MTTIPKTIHRSIAIINRKITKAFDVFLLLDFFVGVLSVVSSLVSIGTPATNVLMVVPSTVGLLVDDNSIGSG